MMSNYWRKWTDEIDALVQNGFVTGQTIDEIANNVFSQMRLEKSTTSKNTLSRARRSAKSVAIFLELLVTCLTVISVVNYITPYRHICLLYLEVVYLLSLESLSSLVQ